MKYKFFFLRISALILSLSRKLVPCILFGFVLCLGDFSLPQVGNAFEGVDQGSSQYFIAAERWKEAEKIFRSDPHWLGGDGATSVDLTHGRVLWLFGDSFIDPSGSGLRRASDLVRNSIAIQTGYDPTCAEMKFSWKMKGGKPAAFFERKGDSWFWPGSGIMVGNRLLIFLMADLPLGLAPRSI